MLRHSTISDFCLVRACKFAVCIVLVASSIGDCDQLVLQRIDTPDIVIPRFNPALGDLNSVQLQVRMLQGTTSAADSHNHGSRPVISSNTINAVQVFNGFAPLTLNSSSNPSTSHSFNSPAYNGNGVFVGNFSGVTNNSGTHSHPVTVTFSAVIPDGVFQWRIRAIENTQSTGPHSHTYPQIVKFLNFPGNGSINPFIGVSDIIIPAGNFSTSSVGNHNHTVPAFSRQVNTSSGTQTAFFDPEFTNSTGPHSHFINPRFTVIATFNFTPAVILGDVNLDGNVNLLDIDPFIDRVSNGIYQVEADTNEDGEVNLLDIDPFIALVSGG